MFPVRCSSARAHLGRAYLGRATWLVLALCVGAGVRPTVFVRADSPATHSISIDDLESRFGQHCFDCHGYGESEGGFSFEHLTGSSDAGLNADDTLRLWESVWQNVRSETMPPSSSELPSPIQRDEWVDWIQTNVFALSPDAIDPGHVVLRRLNRTEYQASIKQLTDVDLDVRELLPPDDTGYGFDTIGEVLTLSPVVLEKYIQAADTIVTKAIPSTGPSPPVIDLAGWTWKMDTFDGAGMNETFGFDRGRVVLREVELDHAGQYAIRIGAYLENAWTKTPQTAVMRVYLLPDGIDQTRDGFAAISQCEPAAELQLSFEGGVESHVDVKQRFEAGKHWIAVEFDPENSETKSVLPQGGEVAYRFGLRGSVWTGPMAKQHWEYTEKERMILVGGAPAKDESTARLRERATAVIRTFAGRAFRRPIDEPTLNRLVDLAVKIEKEPTRSYEDGIAAAVKMILVSPRFLYRVEQPRDPSQTGLSVPLDDHSLATRLSFFLWGTPPDDELLELAATNRLRDEMDSQVDRLISQEWKLRGGVANFVGQWLQTRDIHEVPVDARRVMGIRSQSEADRTFDWRVRQGFRDETERLFEHLITANEPAERLLDARYTFLNRSLARFYGIEGVEHDDMRRVDLPADSHRRGVLTHGSVLLVTSNPTRTSPVKRGLFVLENFLGTPAPPAPPDVPELEAAAEGGDMHDASLREVLERHRADPACASCHQRMDPLGLAMENYNAIGQFRERDFPPRHEGWWEEDPKPIGAEIDAAGTLLTGERFGSVDELAEVLATDRKQDFYRCLVSKWLTFALGRGLTYRDATAVDQIVSQMESDGGKMQSLIKAMVNSPVFTHMRGADHR